MLQNKAIALYKRVKKDVVEFGNGLSLLVLNREDKKNF